MDVKINNKKIVLFTVPLIGFLLLFIYELFFCNSIYFNERLGNYNFSIYRIIMYLVVISVMLLLRKKINVIIEKNSSHKITNMVAIGITLIIMFITIMVIVMRTINIASSVFLMVLLFISLNLFFISKDYKKNAIIIILSFGSIFSLITPINNQLDEKKHFLAAYNLSYCNFDVLNHPLINEKIQNIPSRENFFAFNEYFSERYENQFIDDYVAPDITHTPAPYNAIQYIPSAIGIFIARVMGGSIADIYYAGRIFNLIAYAILIYITLNILPYKKKTLFVVLLMPMLVCLSGVYSIDGIAMGITSIFLAYCFKLYEQKNNISIKQIWILFGIFILVEIAKSMAYIFIGLIVFILPITKIMKENKKHIAMILLLLIIGTLLNSSIFYFGNKDHISDPRATGTNATEQIKYIINNPGEYGSTLYNHTKNSLLKFDALAFLNAPMFFGKNYSYVFFILLLYVLYIGLTDDSKNFNKKTKAIFLTIFLITFFMTSTMLYISYTEVGDIQIRGYQLRYIYPIIPLLLMCLSSNKLKTTESENKEVLKLSYISSIFMILSAWGILLS